MRDKAGFQSSVMVSTSKKQKCHYSPPLTLTEKEPQNKILGVVHTDKIQNAGCLTRNL
jgi:hypothetical protein